jgi:hypothetical protein
LIAALITLLENELAPELGPSIFTEGDPNGMDGRLATQLFSVRSGRPDASSGTSPRGDLVGAPWRGVRIRRGTPHRAHRLRNRPRRSACPSATTARPCARESGNSEKATRDEGGSPPGRKVRRCAMTRRRPCCTRRWLTRAFTDTAQDGGLAALGPHSDGARLEGATQAAQTGATYGHQAADIGGSVPAGSGRWRSSSRAGAPRATAASGNSLSSRCAALSHRRSMGECRLRYLRPPRSSIREPRRLRAVPRVPW